MTDTITIEHLESLAAQMEADDQAERVRLHRLVVAYARIIAAREPDKFPRRCVERADEDGHWDNSYPPKVELKSATGPRAHRVVKHDTTDVATSGGYYHSWRRVTEDQGLYVGPRGQLYGCDETGTGAVGQYAAHPGDHNVECVLEYEQLDVDDVPVERLRLAEQKLRELAFPLVAARTAAA